MTNQDKSSEEVDEIIAKGEFGFIVAYSPTCGPCAQYKPLAIEVGEKENIFLSLLDITTYKPPMNIDAVPTTLIHSKGKIIHKMVGSITKDQLTKKLKELSGK